MTHLAPLTLIATCAVLAACTPGDTPLATVDAGRAARDCFVPSTVRNFRAENDSVAYVRAGRNEVYQLDGGFCRGLSSATALALSSGPSGGRACVGDSVELAVAGPGLQNENTSQCRARVSARLTDDQIAALAPRLRP